MPAFVFPGQGSQRPGMGRPWTDPPVLGGGRRRLRDRRPGHRPPAARRSLDELTETRNAQLATFTFSLLVIDAIERLGIEPTGVAGHSVGEYSALAASGAIGFEDGVRVVAERGEAMQAAADAQPGRDERHPGLRRRHRRHRLPAGRRRGLGRQLQQRGRDRDRRRTRAPWPGPGRGALELGARQISPGRGRRGLSHPVHGPARNRLRKILATITFHDAEIPVVANVDARRHTAAADWELLLSAQLVSPIRWRQSIMRLGGLRGARGRGRAALRRAGTRATPSRT